MYVFIHHMRTADLLTALQGLATRGRWCVSESTLRTFLPGSPNTFRVAMTRHLGRRAIIRVAPGLYLNPFSQRPDWALERLAAHLRPNDYYYLSLESALYEHGRISQVPNRLTLMTSGRTYTHTTPLGVIEFVHTARPPRAWRPRTTLAQDRGMHVASAELAREDLGHVGRNLDLVESEETADALHL